MPSAHNILCSKLNSKQGLEFSDIVLLYCSKLPQRDGIPLQRALPYLQRDEQHTSYALQIHLQYNQFIIVVYCHLLQPNALESMYIW